MVKEFVPRMGYYKESAILRGEDNAEVNSASSDWTLKKTVEMINVDETKPIEEIVYEEKGGTVDVGSIKITVQVAGESENTEILHDPIGKTDYVLGLQLLSRSYYGLLVSMRVYLKGDETDAGYNRQASNFGSTRTEVAYL